MKEIEKKKDLIKDVKEIILWTQEALHCGKITGSDDEIAMNCIKELSIKGGQDELYRKVYIKSESDLPKEEGDYFCNRSGFNSVQHLITTLGKSYMREIRWYLQPLAESQEQSEREDGVKESAEDWLFNNYHEFTLHCKNTGRSIPFFCKMLEAYHKQQIRGVMFGLFKHYTKKYEMTFTDKFIFDMIDEYLKDK